MPAKTILFALVCLAPLRLAADDGAAARTVSYSARSPQHEVARETKPRRLPAGGASALQHERSQDFEVEQATFAAGEPEGVERGAKRNAPLSLPPRSGKEAKGGHAAARPRAVGTVSSVLTGAASLAVVLGLFFGLAWALRRGMPAPPVMLPSEAVEVLGRTPLANRQHAHLIRCGNKVLLVYLSQGVAETLTEITDPLEVDRLTGLCRQSHPQSATKTFRQMLQQIGREKTASGFLDRSEPSPERAAKLPRSRVVDAALEDADV